jgi:diguanylate cyclase (GGDEF)-like protein
MPDTRENNIYKTFILSTSLVIALILSGIFLDMGIRTRQLINEENLIQARVLFNTIVLTRKWNARYGGVYVEKIKDVVSNPYLQNPDVKTVDGRVFTLRNPALMTREISALAEKEGLFKFHITSLKLMNPDNQPDRFEADALHQFETGAVKEVSGTEVINNRTYFRFMAPLSVENSCLPCHKHQNYAIGDVRGGISVAFDIEDLKSKIRLNTFFIIFFGITTTALLMGLIFFFTKRLIKKLAMARQTIEKIAITDDLTGLYNRRHILTRFHEEFEKATRLGKDLSCIIADIDHFKIVNDLYGHQTGDTVLKEVAHRIGQSIRVYDILGRYGGEEFLIILPDTNIEQAWHFAERTRMQVGESPIRDNSITISLGVTCLQVSDQSIDNMIKRADDLLYKAKKTGRDRVEWKGQS